MHHFDIFDEILIDKVEHVFKIAILVVGIVLAFVGVSPSIKEGYQDLKKNNENIEQSVNVLKDAGVSVSDFKTVQDFSNLSNREAIIYECMVCISKEYNINGVTTNTFKKVLTEDEIKSLQNIAASMEQNDADYEKLRNDKAYRIELFGMDGITILYDIVKAHIQDF